MKPFLRSHLPGLVAAVALLVSLPAASLAAESVAPSEADELRALREQIRLLDEKVRSLEAKQAQHADSAAIEKKLLVIERRQEISDERLAVTDKGITLSSADGANFLRLRGLVQADARAFFNDDPALTNNSTFLLRRARLIFEGTFNKNTSFLVTPEFAGSAPTIVDAYANFALSPSFQVRAGRFKEPVGLEQLQSDSAALFIERSLASQLVPNRDLGVQLGGDLLNGTLAYAAGIFDGVPDGSNNGAVTGTTVNADSDKDKDLAVRLFALPFKNDVASPLRGLGFGLAASTGREKPASGLAAYRTAGQQTFFSFRTQSAAAASKTNYTAVPDGTTWRLSPQAYYYYGPFGILGEYAVSTVNVRPNFPTTFVGSPKVELKNTAWQLAVGYVLTGEDATYTGVVPKADFDWASGSWGAWEIVARYESLDLDDKAFGSPGAGYASLADKNNNASKVSGFDLGLNWFLSKTVRASLNYYHSNFGLTAGAVPTTRALLNNDESALVTRLQIAF